MDEVLVVKVISTLIYPLGLVLLLAIMAWLAKFIGAKRFSMLAKTGSVLILLLASNPLFSEWLMRSLEQQYPQQPLAQVMEHDVIIVLGGGLKIPLPPAVSSQIGAGSDRYWHAVNLYKAGKAKKIVITGGNVFKQKNLKSEAYYAAELLQEWGVPESAIVIETKSRTTKQNYQNLLSYLSNNNIKNALLVTSAYHMPRAVELFRQLPITITTASADIRVFERQTPTELKWLPSASALGLTTQAMHEYYGLWFSKLQALFQ